MAIDQLGPPSGSRPSMSGVGHHPAALASLAFDGARFGLATLDADDRLLTANASFRDLMGLSSEQPLHDIEIARLLPIGSALSCSASPSVREGWYEVYSRDAQAESGELLLSVTALEEDGIRLLTLMPRRMVSGGGVSRDALTGLSSPALFRDRLEHALVRAERHEHSFAIMLLELNLPPRPAGLVRWQRWQLLEQASRRLRRVLREEDSLARLDEGSWGVLIEQPLTAQALHGVALRLEEAMDAPFQQGGGSALVTLTIGIARYPEDAEDVDELMESAGVALKTSRCLGPGSHAFRDLQVRREVEARAAILEQLQEALLFPDAHFHLVFQPQCDVETGRWIGLEALVRWPRPGHGVTEHSELLSAIQELGAQVTLDRWVLSQALAIKAAWQRSGLALAGLPLSVKLTLETLDQNVFDGFPLDQFLKRYSAALAGLCLEVPAAAFSALAEQHRHLLKRLQRQGITLVADGLESGPVSLVALAALGVGGAKLAPALVAEMEQSRLVQQGARGLIAGLHELGLTIVAAGVESGSQYALVSRLGVAGLQGHYLCPPLGVDELLGRWEEGQSQV
ncbi:EAL domain-containing protein [Halomonas mongoliensis]|uniref:EAL domain-containing protein n=1 Tax=Halomonas mongoliensis TaxID=321265 RepID=UPI00403AF1B7